VPQRHLLENFLGLFFLARLICCIHFGCASYWTCLLTNTCLQRKATHPSSEDKKTLHNTKQHLAFPYELTLLLLLLLLCCYKKCYYYGRHIGHLFYELTLLFCRHNGLSPLLTRWPEVYSRIIVTTLYSSLPDLILPTDTASNTPCAHSSLSLSLSNNSRSPGVPFDFGVLHCELPPRFIAPRPKALLFPE
jgi:hypothetical protein